MALQLEIISEHAEIVGDDSVREFGEDGGTIGRSLENDWILPDPDKYISGRHAVIDFKGGIYYLADLSTNGTYVNDEHEPIGKGNPRRLFNGDRLRMGDFEMTVAIDQGESIAMPLEPDPVSVVPDNIEQLVPEASIRTGMTLLDEEEITGDDEFEAHFQAQTGVKEELPTLPNEDEISTSGNYEAEYIDVPRSEDSVVRQKLPGSDGIFDVFLEGLGLTRNDLHPSVDPAEIMQNAGEVLREFVDGMGKLLISRANLKGAFRLDQTTVLPRHNNPLKLSENTEDSVMQLLVGREGEYLGPKDAVREVCRDLLFHQDAFLDAMTAAFVEFADRFDPDEIKNASERDGKAKAWFAFLAGNKLWQYYNDMYPVLTERGGGRFPQMFAEEFVQSYERQINEFKRLNPDNSPCPKPKLEPLSEEEFNAAHLGETQKLEPEGVANLPDAPAVVDDTEVQAEMTDDIAEELTGELEAALNEDDIFADDGEEAETRN